MSEPFFLELPWPPSVNHYWRSVNGRVLISRDGRAYREAVGWIVRRAHVAKRTDSIAVHVEAWMPDRRRRDADNLLKAPLDALTAAGAWADDSQIVDLRVTKQLWQRPGRLRVWVRDGC